MIFDYEISEEDIDATRKRARLVGKQILSSYPANKIMRVIVGALLAISVLMVLGMYKQYSGSTITDFTYVISSLIALVVASIIAETISSRKLRSIHNQALAPFPFKQRIETLPDGIAFESRLGNSLCKWSSISQITEDNAYISFVMTPNHVFLVPKSKISEPDLLISELKYRTGSN